VRLFTESEKEKPDWNQLVFFLFSIFLCYPKSGDQLQEDLAKSGYKTNREVENLGILFPVGGTTRTY
jgi:hypothetical protein